MKMPAVIKEIVASSLGGLLTGYADCDMTTVVYREVLPAVSIDLISTGVRICFTGESGSTYQVERAPAIIGPWETLATRTAPIGGLIEYLDMNPPPGQAFYRTAQP